MDELLVEVGLHPADTDALHRLVADWQLLADLSFADLVLFVPVGEDRFAAVAQMRPTTGPTAYQDDLVGTTVSSAQRPQLAVAMAEGRICREGEPVWLAGTPVREESVPVRSREQVVAVVGRDTNLASARTPSRLEIAYLQSANDLAQMLSEGRWPHPDGPPEGSGALRVGDGLIRLDADGIVTFASPNALSAYRRLGHRGDLVGSSLAELTGALAAHGTVPLDENIGVVARGRAPRAGDVELGEAVVRLRALPLRPGGEHIGAVVLVHDITELRRRERQLLSKDATIREIHHRVKNNLQTVAALLRLQARRMVVPEARDALEESVRRVSTIAVVHETLSGALEDAVDFDGVADRVLSMVADVAGTAIAVRRDGTFGVLPAAVATPLAMVLTELVQNAVEHGYGGQGPGAVDVVVERREGADPALRVTVLDAGRGLPPGFTIDGSDRLGLAIARALVESELGGRLRLVPGQVVGTAAIMDLARISGPARS